MNDLTRLSVIPCLTPGCLPPGLVAAIATAAAPVATSPAIALAIAALVPRPGPRVCPQQEEQPQQTRPQQRRRQEGEGLVEGEEGGAPRGEDLPVLPLLTIKTRLRRRAEAYFERIAGEKYVCQGILRMLVFILNGHYSMEVRMKA